MTNSETELLWLENYLGNPPFAQEGVLIIRGLQLPYVTIRRSLDPARDGEVSVVLEHGLVIDVPEGDLHQWMPFVAEAMARAHGMTGYGESARPLSSFFGRPVHMITDVETQDYET